MKPAADATPDEIRQFAQWMRFSKASESQAKARLELIDTLKERRFDFLTQPPASKPRFLLTGKSICTPGNLTAIIAQAKAGKSAFIGAMAAAHFVAQTGNTDCDLLGVTAASDQPGKLLWIDTEQSREDFDGVVRRAIRRAGLDSEPESLVSYGLAGMNADSLLKAFYALLWYTSLDGVFAVIIDGVADLCSDVNDAEECNALVAGLHGLAIKFDCPIICVLHENPTHDTGKARGHLGSQLERKAESNLRLKKCDQITVVFSEKMRRAPIPESDGPRFVWSDQHGMHVSCQSVATTKDDAKRERLRDQAEAVFMASGIHAMTWSAFRDGIGKSEGIGQSGATKRFDAMKALGVVKKDEIGMWRLT